MQKIFKYELDKVGRNVINTFACATVLCAKEQYDKIIVYLLVDLSEVQTEATFVIVPTGVYIEDYIQEEGCPSLENYVGTVLVAKGGLVWHIFSLTLPIRIQRSIPDGLIG